MLILYSKSVAFGRGGSSPPTGTIFQDRASTKVGALLFLAFVNSNLARRQECLPSWMQALSPHLSVPYIERSLL
ncbi:hypothetical protein DMJ21_24235 [Vibrio parahaemolyticus]|nr:hypothetical protein [Vibrio parahaemolyticus]EGR3320657.1 hypothetical protein [Vibrio parahaemolyticus]